MSDDVRVICRPWGCAVAGALFAPCCLMFVISACCDQDVPLEGRLGYASCGLMFLFLALHSFLMLRCVQTGDQQGFSWREIWGPSRHVSWSQIRGIHRKARVIELESGTMVRVYSVGARGRALWAMVVDRVPRHSPFRNTENSETAWDIEQRPITLFGDTSIQQRDWRRSLWLIAIVTVCVTLLTVYKFFPLTVPDIPIPYGLRVVIALGPFVTPLISLGFFLLIYSMRPSPSLPGYLTVDHAGINDCRTSMPRRILWSDVTDLRCSSDKKRPGILLETERGAFEIPWAYARQNWVLSRRLRESIAEAARDRIAARECVVPTEVAPGVRRHHARLHATRSLARRLPGLSLLVLPFALKDVGFLVIAAFIALPALPWMLWMRLFWIETRPDSLFWHGLFRRRRIAWSEVAQIDAAPESARLKLRLHDGTRLSCNLRGLAEPARLLRALHERTGLKPRPPGAW